MKRKSRPAWATQQDPVSERTEKGGMCSGTEHWPILRSLELQPQHHKKTKRGSSAAPLGWLSARRGTALCTQ